MKKLLLFILPVLLGLSSCNLFNNYGKKVKIGESEVFYKGEGVSEEDAEKVGDFLIKYELINKKEKSSVQVTKEDDAYVVHLIIDPEKMEKSARLNMWKLQHDLSEDVFDGKQARFAFADDKLKDLDVLEPVNRLTVGKGGIYYDNSEFKKSEAKKLGDFLQEKQYMGEEKKVDVFLIKEGDAPVVRLVVDKDLVEQNKETVIPAFSYWQSLIQNEVLDKKARLVLTAVNYEDFKKVPKLTAEEKQAFENQLNQQENTTADQTTVDSVTTQTSSGVVRLPNQ